MHRFATLVTGITLLALTAPALSQSERVVLVTHDSFAVSDAVLRQFTEQTGYDVEILRVGDAGLLVNQAVLTAGNPLGDVLFGVDNTFLGRALAYDVFEPYDAIGLTAVDDAFKADGAGMVTPVDYGDVCINYDRAALPDADNRDWSLEDFADPAFRSMLAVQDPALSSPGLAFLLTTIAAYGDSDDTDGDTYLEYWRRLIENDVAISPSWTDAYYGEFSGSASSTGTRPLVVSYASSPPAEVAFAETPPDEAPTGAITADDTCFRQIEYAGVLRGAANEAGAQSLIDFMLSLPFQEDMPLNMFVFPVNPEAALPDVFERYAVIPRKPVIMDSATIEANRERWLQEWTDAVLGP